MSKFINLIPLAMRVPTGACIYQVSKFGGPKRMAKRTFRTRYTSITVKVCPLDTTDTEEIYAKCGEVEAFSFGLDGWYVKPRDFARLVEEVDHPDFVSLVIPPELGDDELPEWLREIEVQP